MSDNINIGSGIKSISPYEKGTNYYYAVNNAPKKNNPQFNRFRVGEIVRGTILENPTENITEVRLPIGNYKTELHNNLMKGDELYFKIEETQPNLILKIHSAPLYKNKSKLIEEEIHRILDLPLTQGFLSITSEYSLLNSQIIKDDILYIYKLLSEYISKDDRKQFETYSIRTAIFISESNIKANHNIFEIFNKFFENEKNYQSAINAIIQNLDKFDNIIKKEIVEYLKKNNKSSLPIRKISVVV